MAGTKTAAPLFELGFQLGARLRSWIGRARDYRQMRHERAQLLGLSDRELRDIGISRVDAIHAATRPLRGRSFRHAPTCSGHPRRSAGSLRDVDGRNKCGHDDYYLSLRCA
jgi:uncharacterized protein YjiS (DUF1127 family)